MQTTDQTETRESGSQQRDGSAAGSITHIFRTELTRSQAKELKAIWSEHGKNGGMIIMQPVLNWSVFDLKNCFAQGIVLDEECRKKIFEVIESAKRQNNKLSESARENQKP